MAGFCIVSNDNTRPTTEFIFPLGGAVCWVEVLVCTGVATVTGAEGVVWTDVLEVVVVVLVDGDGDETAVGSD